MVLPESLGQAVQIKMTVMLVGQAVEVVVTLLPMGQ